MPDLSLNSIEDFSKAKMDGKWPLAPGTYDATTIENGVLKKIFFTATSIGVVVPDGAMSWLDQEMRFFAVLEKGGSITISQAIPTTDQPSGGVSDQPSGGVSPILIVAGIVGLCLVWKLSKR